MSASAIINVDNVYATITSEFTSRYPVYKFNNYSVYMTNEETVQELDSLSPINTMWESGTGLDSRHWIRGGTGQKFLWITEQMICKKGVKTRGDKDNYDRKFDQVIHEFGHAIDFRFQLTRQINNVFRRANLVNFRTYEQWAVAVQNWFDSPNGDFYEGELELLKSIFKNRQSFSCSNYKPE